MACLQRIGLHDLSPFPSCRGRIPLRRCPAPVPSDRGSDSVSTRSPIRWPYSDDQSGGGGRVRFCALLRLLFTYLTASLLLLCAPLPTQRLLECSIQATGNKKAHANGETGTCFWIQNAPTRPGRERSVSDTHTRTQSRSTASVATAHGGCYGCERAKGCHTRWRKQSERAALADRTDLANTWCIWSGTLSTSYLHHSAFAGSSEAYRNCIAPKTIATDERALTGELK